MNLVVRNYVLDCVYGKRALGRNVSCNIKLVTNIFVSDTPSRVAGNGGLICKRMVLWADVTRM